MSDQAAAKKILQELVRREDLKNKICNDCSNPNPQWASLSFAVFICLQCAGTHRGFGVHISFVRSVSMDTWQDDQIKRMQLGGNLPFRQFMQSYTPAEQGGYKEGQSPYDTYHCWAATQYREKLDAELAGKPWSPSLPPPGFGAPRSDSPGRPSSAQGLRKSRTSTRQATGSSLRGDSASPAPFAKNDASPQGTPGSTVGSGNETYFAALGQANASRPDHLPPSQGGRYTGFGSTPAPSAPEHPSWGMSSAAVPTLGELQENPLGALGKGWSLFSSAVVGASRAINENVIQPGLEKVTDPTLQASVKGYASEAQQRAARVGGAANQWSRQQLGVDVADTVGAAVGTVRERIGVGHTSQGYGQLAQDHDAETSALYHDEEDDFFREYDQSHSGGYGGSGLGASGNAGATSTTTASNTQAAAKKDKDGWDDDWKDF